MEKERKILFNFTSYILLGFLICLIGISNVFASTYDSSQFEARLYDNYGTSLQYVTTELIYGWQGTIPSMVANSTGGAWGISSPISLLKDHTYSLTVEITGTFGGSLILSSKNRIGVGRNYDDAIYSYVNGTNSDLKYSKITGGYTLQFAFTAKGDSSYLIIPFATSLSGGPWEFRLQNIIIDDLGKDGVTQEEITNSLNNQTNIINNTINNMGEDIKDSINENFNSCRDSYNILKLIPITQGIASVTNTNVILNGTVNEAFGLKVGEVNLKAHTTYTFESFKVGNQLSSYFLINQYGDTIYLTSDTVQFLVTSNNTYEFYLIVTPGTYSSVNFKPMISEGDIARGKYELFGEEICQNKIDETNDKLDQTNDKLNDLNNSLNDDDTSGATNDASNFFSNFTTDTFGLTSIITSPLALINSLTSKSCSTLELPLPYLNDKYLELPCMDTIYTNYFGDFFEIYQIITFGIVSYWVIVRIFNQVKDFKNPEHDEIEVVDL